ncbi:phosphopantetheine-binding protein [Paenibacillus sp. LPE1-1-1.1]|uniref:phosphopantetheine-binding protein n=1 Tax=Paenibacillus sp. LPE1-1-1.1 TaxID=3135230 RepID=UPI00344162A7
MSLNREEIINQLKSVIVNNLEIELAEDLNESDRLYEDLNIDSIMSLQLVVYIEEVFNVSVPEEEIDPTVYETVGKLATFIEQLQAA